MSAHDATFPQTLSRPSAALAAIAVKTLHAIINSPQIIFIAALTAMLFRPPDLKAFPVDRIAFCTLLAVFGLRLCLRREQLHIYPATLPLVALLTLALMGALQEKDGHQAWSLLAAKWIVPLALFHISGSVFRDQKSRRQLEIFSLAVLSYLTFTSLMFLLDAKWLIFPKFILDEGIGIHADRARGPLLQAVANGVCLNILALIALDAYRRRGLRAVWAFLIFATAPLALLATRTRAVWLSAAVSVVLVAFFARSSRVRRSALTLCVATLIAFCGLLSCVADTGTLCARLLDRSPVEFRLDMYRAGWQMFTVKPLVGWGSEANIQPEMERRISSFHPERYLVHNTYLELAIERGSVGLALYAWLFLCLFRLSRTEYRTGEGPFLEPEFRRLWPIILVAYLLNASAVVMNYQFVNGYVFTLAGILSAENVKRSAARVLPG